MPGISSMLPIGGDAVWGNHTWAPDDVPGNNVTYGNFLNFKQVNSTIDTPGNLTVSQALPYLCDHPAFFREGFQAVSWDEEGGLDAVLVEHLQHTTDAYRAGEQTARDVRRAILAAIGA